jgi:dTMP kinase
MSPPGFLLTVDGPGGVGKSELVAALTRRFRHRTPLVHPTAEPSGSRLGLTTRALANEVRGKALALLVAADRHHHLATEVQPRLATGHLVICDRYLASSLVLQRLDGVPLDFIRAINAGIVLPDLAVILTAPPDIIARRLVDRGAHHRFEWDLGNVSRELGLYEHAIEILESMSVRVLRIDVGSVTPESVAVEIARMVTIPSASVAPITPPPTMLDSE